MTLNTLANELDDHMYENGLRFSDEFAHLNNDNFGIFDTADAMADAMISTLPAAIELMTEKDI